MFAIVHRLRTQSLLASGAVALVLSATTAARAGEAQAAPAAYPPVTDERLANPEPENWLQYRGNYQGWGYSPLDQIDTTNVKKLVPAWSVSTGVSDGHEAPPIVNNGIMFVSTPGDQILAVRAATGQVLWKYQRELPPELFQLHPTNRGVALYGSSVLIATLDACVVSLDAETGKQNWQKCVADWKDSYYMTLSPMVTRGKVIVGVSGGEFGIRGFITALNTTNGDEVWKTYTVPAPGEPGSESWKGDSWKTGGGPIWIQGTYDAKLNIAYFGTGNGGPWDPTARPGDNLYTTSAVALDADTGKIKGYHQYHYNDAWDWDEVSSPILIDVKRNGKTIPAVVHAARDGYLWTLERGSDGSLKYLDGKPFVYQNVFTKLDPVTGRPTYDEARVPHLGITAAFCPGLWGGKDWFPEAYNPKTRLLYVPANDNLCATLTDIKIGRRKPGELFIGAPVAAILKSLSFRPGTDTSKPVTIGEIQAWDMDSGKKVWQHEFKDTSMWGPLLTTAGGLVFAGGTSDRMFRAFDAKNGNVLWETKLNSGVVGVPTSFQVAGTQYIAVQAGWGGDADRMLQGINDALPEARRLKVAPQGGVIWVFKVAGQEAAK